MTMPDTHSALAAALAAVQAELPAGKKTRSADVKNKEGRFLYSYAYADLADVSAAIMPILGKHGLAFTAFPGHQPDGKFGLRYWLMHSDGGTIEGFYEITDQGGMQMVGGRITYARRYCLCAVTGIAAEEDVDASDDGNGRRMQRRQQPAAGRGEQSPQRTAQRGPRPSHSPAQPAEGLPPLPGEEEPDPTPAPGATQATHQDSPAPAGELDGAAPGTVTGPQITAIWTVLSQVYKFSRDEKDAARQVCAHIAGRPLASTKDMSRDDGRAVLDTLANWRELAESSQMTPREALTEIMADAAAAAAARGGSRLNRNSVARSSVIGPREK